MLSPFSGSKALRSRPVQFHTSEGESQACLFQRGTCGLDTTPGLMVHQVTLSKSLSSSCFPFSCPRVWGRKESCPLEGLERCQGPGVPLGSARCHLKWKPCSSYQCVCLCPAPASCSSVFSSTHKRHLFCFPGAERLDKCSVSSSKAVFSETLRCFIRWSGASNGNFRLFALTAQE